MEMVSFAAGMNLGIDCCNKEIKSAEREISDTTSKVIINYVDGSIYTMTCSRTETDTKVTLTDVTETWTKAKTEKSTEISTGESSGSD